jgi:hypothetical protein
MKSTYTAKKTILASSVFLGMAFGTAHAEQCFKLAPFVDLIRISGLALTDGPAVGSTHRMFVGSWIATGAYVLPIVGSKAFDLGSTTVFRFGLHGTNVKGAFGGNESCALDGIEGGAWSLACPASPNPVGPGTAPFTNKGSPFTKVTCAKQPPSVTEKAAGDPK